MDSLDLNLLPERNCYKWSLVKIEPLENLKNYKDHHRLMLFYQKGVTCALCGKQHGAYIAHYKTHKGDIHVDVYTEDGVMINRDHIIPRSKGGANILENLQPTCEPCNTKKGNGDSEEEKEAKRIKRGLCSNRFSVGDIVHFKKESDNKGSKTEYKVLELLTKGRVLLDTDHDGVSFRMAKSKIAKCKINKEVINY